MSISIIIVLWIIISIAQAVNDRKKNPQPPPPVPPPNNSTDSNFEIPTLANDPNQNSEIEEIDNFDEYDEFDDVEEKPDIEEIYQQRKMDIKNKSATSETEAVKEKNIELDLTPAAVLNAIVLNDILDKPKALRRRNF